MSQAQSYNQTILLDANRLSSEEYSASSLAQTDNAIFTNKVSNGITLDVGDQVSIQSAHIAQRGAGGSVIQFSGEILGEKTITETEVTNSSYVGTEILLDQPTYSPTGYAYETSENVEKQVKVKDNGASIIVEYYKTTNGENNISLPRNFGSASGGNSVHAGEPEGAGVTSASFYSASDAYRLGLNTYYCSSSHVFRPDFDNDIGAVNACNADCRVRKLLQDNSKYTIFKRSEMVWDYNSVSSASAVAFLTGGAAGASPDPAIGGYNRFQQKVDLSIQPGYNSPSTISSEITNELIKTNPPLNIIENNDSLVIDSTLYKAFSCANYTLFNASTNTNFFNGAIRDSLPVSVGAASVDSASAVHYLQNYAFVGFKRPDFVEAGRQTTAYHGNGITNNLLSANNETEIVVTNITWSDEVLIRLKKFFDTQRLYPELLDHAADAAFDITNYSTYNTTSASLNASFREEARFIHFDVSASQKAGAAALGSDMYNVSYSSTNFQPPRTNASDGSSAPLFFYFNNNCSHLTASQTIGDTYDNLAYGFAKKVGNFIAFTTERIGGIAENYYGEQGTNTIHAGTKIGYDYHFNAYGNAAILLSSGYNPVQYYGHQAYRSAQYIRQVYLGANNPLFNFDTTESRFELSNLHSAEKVGNFYNGGDPNPPAKVFAPPASAQAGQDCYKINKALKYDSWTPCLQPYPLINLEGSFTTDTQNTFIQMSKSLLPSVIYDAHGGISLRDMGVTEDLWEKSFWGLCGYEYGQFNASGNIEDISNINIRFTDDTTNTSGITTNADVTSVNSLEFSTNAFGTTLFNPLVNSHVEYYNSATQAAAIVGATADFQVEPPIVVTADSTKIKAKNLPRKILRGYFLINSDILDTANYYQTANPLQTMAIVGKYNGNNDFVEYDGGGAVFTVTRQKTITAIKSQILDPEGGLAQVGDNSGIIYRIDKPIKTDLKFAENLMAGMYGKVQQ